MKNKKSTTVSFPENIVAPVKKFLEDELKRLNDTKKSIDNADPFNDDERDERNSLEDDVDEQIGHLDTEIKSKFLQRQIVQIRQALTRLKLGKYGICEVCGQMIDTDRLAAGPQTTLCIKCAKDKE
jgi:DnaK suppressor protein